MAKNEVVTTPAGSADHSQVPAYLQGQDFKREDNFDTSDITLPRVKLLQGTSQEVLDYEGAKSGEFWHTGLDQSLGTEFSFIVADRRKKYLLMAPMQDGQGILARADDAVTWDRTGEWSVKLKNVKNPVKWVISDTNVARSGLTEWGTYYPEDEDSPPAATLFYDNLIFIPDMIEFGPAVMSLARTAIKKAKKGLNDKIDMHRQQGRPMQALRFKARVVPDQADGQDFWNWQFISDGFVQDKEFFDMLRGYVGALGRFRIADEGDTGEAEHDGGSAEAPENAPAF